MAFRTVQEARDAVKQEVDQHIRNLEKLGQHQSINSDNGFVWCRDSVRWKDELLKFRISLDDPYVQEVLDDLENSGYISGYINKNKLGIIMITSLGYQNRGNW